MNQSIVEAISDMLEQKGMDKSDLEEIVESAFISVLKKQFDPDSEFSVTFNTERGDIEIFRIREVVEDGEVENPHLQIALSEAQEVEEDLEPGDDFVELIDYRKFGRRAILNLKNAIFQKTREVEKATIFEEYSRRIGEIIYADIYQINPRTRDVILNFEKVSFRMPAEERIPREIYHRKKRLRVMIKDVVKKNKNEPEIIVSRADKNFILHMFEVEVPEIAEGIIKIRSIARVPGWRSKVAVESTDPRIHAVGSCVGMKGVRIQAIVGELKREKIDIIEYSSDKTRLVKNALVPTVPAMVEELPDGRIAAVFSDKDYQKILDNIQREQDEQVEEGDLPPNTSGNPKDINVRLVEQLVGVEIVPTTESRHIAEKLHEQEMEQELILEDVDELTEEELDSLREGGYYYAEAVLDDPLEEVLAKTGLNEEQVAQIKQKIGAYFQDLKITDVLELPENIRSVFLECGYEFVDDVLDADNRSLKERTGLSDEDIAAAVEILTRYSEDEQVTEENTAPEGETAEETETGTSLTDGEARMDDQTEVTGEEEHGKDQEEVS